MKQQQKALKSLSKISGLSEKAVKEIWVNVKANHKLLDSCFFHIFKSHPSPNMSRRFVCENCKVVVGTREKDWYEKGIEHSQPSNNHKAGSV